MGLACFLRMRNLVSTKLFLPTQLFRTSLWIFIFHHSLYKDTITNRRTFAFCRVSKCFLAMSPFLLAFHASFCRSSMALNNSTFPMTLLTRSSKSVSSLQCRCEGIYVLQMGQFLLPFVRDSAMHRWQKRCIHCLTNTVLTMKPEQMGHLKSSNT